MYTVPSRALTPNVTQLKDFLCVFIALRWNKHVCLTFDFKISPCYECCILAFWVIPRRLNFICRRFETLCLFHLPRRCKEDEWPGAKPSQAEILTGDGDLREAQVDVPLSVSHTCV